MADDQFDQETEALHWMQASAFIEAYGEQWQVQAMANVNAVAVGDNELMGRWLDLIEKMTQLAHAPRQ